MKDIAEGSGEFVVSRSDGPVDFEMPNHALYAVAFAIDALVPDDFGFAREFGRNARADARTMQGAADGVGVVSLVGEEIARRLVGQSHHVFECRAVRSFSGCEMEGERGASGITETMNFTGEPAPRAAKSLFASPPFAPAAET